MSRKTKISCDVTREADNMLKAYCKKHERSKGYLIEKMIRKFCVDAEEVVVKPKTKAKTKKFTKPTIEEAGNYFVELGFGFELGQQFIDHNDTRGWIVGRMKTPMKDWKAAIRTWTVGKSKDEPEKLEIRTPADAIALVKKGQITALSQIPKEHRRLMETQFLLGKYKPETMDALTKIGMAV